MTEFHLNTSGEVRGYAGLFDGRVGRFTERGNEWGVRWDDLDAFTQGYVEAMFFASCDEPGMFNEEEPAFAGGDTKPVFVGFADLAPEALARILADCAKFCASDAYAVMKEDKGRQRGGLGSRDHNATQAGRDFWFTRNGHGVGFWDGDWPEPYAAALDEAAKAFGETDAYLGDDGKVWLS